MITEIDNKLGAAIDRTMQYYAFFRFPLQVQEIRRYCSMVCNDEDVLAYLNEQQLHGKVFNHNGYFTLLPDVASLLERRMQGKEKAMKDLKVARRVGRLIYQFPFVSFVGISGSLSKGYSDSRSDCDFFIVTRKDRLWISRTILHVFKKLSFIVGQQHKLCMNYFIDESALLLQEQNIYTATELCSLIPVSGAGIHRQLMQANNAWVSSFLPNYNREVTGVIKDKNGIVKNLLSGIINVMYPAGLNRLLMTLTDFKWRRKWAKKGYPGEDYDLAFKTRLNISKNHALNYQKKILEAIRRKDQ